MAKAHWENIQKEDRYFPPPDAPREDEGHGPAAIRSLRSAKKKLDRACLEGISDEIDDIIAELCSHIDTACDGLEIALGIKKGEDDE